MEEKITAMNLSARNIVSNKDLIVRIKEYEGDIGRLKAGLRKACLLYQGISGKNITPSEPNMRLREQMASGTKTMEDTNGILGDAIQTAHGIEVDGEGIMENLQIHKEKMWEIKDKLQGVNVKLVQASQVMKRIGRRAISNKLIMAVIVMVLILAICLIIYIKFFSGNATNDVQPTPEPTSNK